MLEVTHDCNCYLRFLFFVMQAPSQVSGSVCLCTFDRVVVSVTLEEQDHIPGRLKLQLVEPKVML